MVLLKAQAPAALTKRTLSRKDNKISLGSKVKLITHLYINMSGSL